MKRLMDTELWQIVNEIANYLNLNNEEWERTYTVNNVATYVMLAGVTYVTKTVSDGRAVMCFFQPKDHSTSDLGFKCNFIEHLIFDPDVGITVSRSNTTNKELVIDAGTIIRKLTDFNHYANIVETINDIDAGLLSPLKLSPSICDFIKVPAVRKLTEDMFDLPSLPVLYNPKAIIFDSDCLSYDALKVMYDAIMQKARDIFISKNKDYATSEDALAGFRKTAEKAGITPLQAWSVFSSKHIAAIDAYVKGHSEESEPIEGRIADAINYMAFLYALIKAEK